MACLSPRLNSSPNPPPAPCSTPSSSPFTCFLLGDPFHRPVDMPARRPPQLVKDLPFSQPEFEREREAEAAAVLAAMPRGQEQLRWAIPTRETNVSSDREPPPASPAISPARPPRSAGPALAGSARGLMLTPHRAGTQAAGALTTPYRVGAWAAAGIVPRPCRAGAAATAVVPPRAELGDRFLAHWRPPVELSRRPFESLSLHGGQEGRLQPEAARLVLRRPSQEGETRQAPSHRRLRGRGRACPGVSWRRLEHLPATSELLCPSAGLL